MHNEFTAIIERDEDWYIAYCAEIPGANGQGKTKTECLKSLTEAIELILEDKRQDVLRGISEGQQKCQKMVYLKKKGGYRNGSSHRGNTAFERQGC